MFALISPEEKIYDFEGVEIGVRIAEVSKEAFDVAKPLYWISCTEGVDDTTHYYNENKKEICDKPLKQAIEIELEDIELTLEDEEELLNLLDDNN